MSIETLYARFISGELTEDEIKTLKQSGEWEELEKIVNAFEDLEMPPVNLEEEYNHFKKNIRITQPSKERNIGWWIGIAASFIGLLMIGIVIMRDDLETIRAEYGDNQLVALPDGSEVRLNDGSSLSYDRGSFLNERSLKLVGEGFFKVEKGENFSVESNNGSIQVLGTSFNVRSWGKTFSVDCYSGKVQVNSGDKSIILEKGQSTYLDEGNLSLIKLDSISAPSWIDDILIFRNEEIRTVFKELERQFNIKISTVFNNKKFNGTVNAKQLELALEQVCKPFNLTYLVSEDRKLITIE